MKKTTILNDVEYEYSLSEGAAFITSAKCDYQERVEIPSNIEGCSVVKINSGFANYLHTDELILPNVADVLTQGCFWQNTTISNVVIPEKIEIIPQKCFQGSSVCKISFKAPQNIKSIQDYAFADMNNLSTFEWPKGCHTIPSCCFHNSGLKTIAGLENVVIISENAFEGTLLESITLFEGIKCIKRWAFANSCLKELKIPNMGIQVSDTAFDELPCLEKVVVPRNQYSIPGNYFKRCPKLKEIVFTSPILDVDKINAVSVIDFHEKDIVLNAEQCETIRLGRGVGQKILNHIKTNFDVEVIRMEGL